MTRLRQTRRRFLTIAAAALALPGAAKAAPLAHWRGWALGAGATITLAGVTGIKARPIFAAMESELERLERIFSLYRPDSALARLNREGKLPAPPAELLEVLSISDAIHRASGGVFDPTVQPLWQALATGGDIAAARALVGWQNLRFDAEIADFLRPGMALTLNGIAQGYVTDRIAALLKAQGFDNILVDMGEIAGLGQKPDGKFWRAGIATPDGKIVHRIQLRDRALATSAPLGTVLDRAGTQGHIFDPKGRLPRNTLVSVSAPRAVIADGLSTAMCMLSGKAADNTIRAFDKAAIEVLT
ncbi:Thiamine biosynthesis lipoprotein ApbE precursor [Roseovarius litorisediminis]|uniref:FAD:protein FMN transferase n=1 Tax=Roseovarius litorisediminis TaxID=1312363 RepID=A0A1Y5SQR1_9RHOB|nr:FAD:protein FMN transferase [Roseovarius litorisediminis]SLN44444.1 Thiamine biosynthesis lipoprotein ApbE precursor [Roseovarius litorisediminis]